LFSVPKVNFFIQKKIFSTEKTKKGIFLDAFLRLLTLKSSYYEEKLNIPNIKIPTEKTKNYFLFCSSIFNYFYCIRFLFHFLNYKLCKLPLPGISVREKRPSLSYWRNIISGHLILKM